MANKGYPTNTWAELIWSGLLVLITSLRKLIPSWVFVISVYSMTPFNTSWIWLFYIPAIFLKCHWNYLRGADLTGQSLQMVSALLIIQKFRNNCRMSRLRRNFSLSLRADFLYWIISVFFVQITISLLLCRNNSLLLVQICNCK